MYDREDKYIVIIELIYNLTKIEKLSLLLSSEKDSPAEDVVAGNED